MSADAATIEMPTPVESRVNRPEPVTVVIFGGAGDLAHRKLLPALYNLHLDGVLPAGTAVVGVGRKELSDEQYREFARDGVQQFSRRGLDEARWDQFAASLFFVNASLDQDTGAGVTRIEARCGRA